MRITVKCKTGGQELTPDEYPGTQLRYEVRNETDVVSLHFWEEDAQQMAAVPRMLKALEAAAWIPVDDRLPSPESWCWVTDGKSAWIALHDKSAAGGWTNGDCWEDFDREVTAWFPAGDHPPLPAPPVDAK